LELEHLAEQVASTLRRSQRRALQPVINATGVILQTNLGRAPLAKSAIDALVTVACGYCNLEFDLEAGERGHRGAYAEELLLRILECDREYRAALIVNNCAAATFLALNSLAEGGEVIVSRGELVEIGGGFRVPDILRKSGVRLREVGTTNRTRIADYAAAITAETRLILRVHRSNFQIVGFTEQPKLEELIQLGAQTGAPVMEDQGTGCVFDLTAFGIPRQSSFAESARSGAALVCASGDKLLGGPQCGLIVGEPGLVARIRRNPLYRAMRVDKLTYAALQATVLAYLSGQADAIPTIAMLKYDVESIRRRCTEWAAVLAVEGARVEVVRTDSVLGGGTTPGTTLPSFAVSLEMDGTSADDLAARLRVGEPPIVARIRERRVLFDLRTVPQDGDAWIPEAVRAAMLSVRNAGSARPENFRRTAGAKE
jgi:L-seryl-tRNA(Ser) seleniumtransferase